jgi:hypothetical protein
MREPTPPRVMIENLTPEGRVKVIKLALSVVHDLGAGRDWSAYEQIEFANLDAELKVAFWSLLDSSQRTTIKSLAEAARVNG